MARQPKPRTAQEILGTTREQVEASLWRVSPRTWPPRHRLHKYWGRKPANLVARHVSFFSAPGERVLDPFAGSGVTLVEASRLGRDASGFDLNPFAARLGAALLAPPDPEKLQREAQAVMGELAAEVDAWYATRCRTCGGPAQARGFVHEGSRLCLVRYACPSCGAREEHPPDPEDLALAARPASAPRDAPDADIYPGWQMRKLLGKGLSRWRELFTPRNYRLAALLRARILATKDPRVREWLLLTLTACLAQLTRMIADYQGRAGGPSWKINSYWLPGRWQELNPLRYFGNRVRKSVAAAADLRIPGLGHSEKFPGLGRGEITRLDSRRLPLADGSVEYVFTDPPYGGEGVQYGELVLLWCVWLGERERLEQEIAFNPKRGLSDQDYREGLAAVFSEVHRVLRPGRWMTVTFANKDPAIWQSLLNACTGAGFKLITSTEVTRSAPALTETTMAKAPKTDHLLIYRR